MKKRDHGRRNLDCASQAPLHPGYAGYAGCPTADAGSAGNRGGGMAAGESATESRRGDQVMETGSLFLKLAFGW